MIAAGSDKALYWKLSPRPTAARGERIASPCGTLSSSTMMVMMMAMTPSLKASTRLLLISVMLARNRREDGIFRG